MGFNSVQSSVHGLIQEKEKLKCGGRFDSSTIDGDSRRLARLSVTSDFHMPCSESGRSDA